VGILSSSMKPALPSAFFMVQLSDPQFGLQYNNLRWDAEEAMLNESIAHINRLSPLFVVLTGDMQNCKSDMQNCDAGQAELQVASVKRSLSLLDDSIPLRAVMPGNHDIGDAPSTSSLESYAQTWGTERSSFQPGARIRFLAIDSSLYFNSSLPGVAHLAREQTAWLDEQLSNAGDEEGGVGMVLLTHIPPFVVDADEPHGWANWPRGPREEVLHMSQRRSRAAFSLIVCGHFHANVEEVSSAAFGVPIEIVTSSSIGSPIQWNGSDASPLPHWQARILSTTPSGAQVFEEYVLRDHGLGPVDPHRVADRVAALPNRSGVRLFEFSADEGYRHQWFTVEQLRALPAPIATGDDSPLATRPFTRWAHS